MWLRIYQPQNSTHLDDPRGFRSFQEQLKNTQPVNDVFHWVDVNCLTAWTEDVKAEDAKSLE